MFRNVLVPLDGSPLAEQAVPQASAIARAAGAGVYLILVHHRVPISGFEHLPLDDFVERDEAEYLGGIARELTSGASIPVTWDTCCGDPSEVICGYVREAEVDLVVMTTHGRTGLSRAWMGSTADRVLRQSSVPVLMLHPIRSSLRARAARHVFKTILVPVDGSPLSDEILTAAVALAQCGDARLVLLSVVQPVPMILREAVAADAYAPMVADSDATERVATRARAELGAKARNVREQRVDCVGYVVIADHVARAILDAAGRHEADAIAMSTHGRGASRVLMGSVTDKVLRASDLPMLLLRPAGRVEPLRRPRADADGTLVSAG